MTESNELGEKRREIPAEKRLAPSKRANSNLKAEDVDELLRENEHRIGASKTLSKAESKENGEKRSKIPAEKRLAPSKRAKSNLKAEDVDELLRENGNRIGASKTISKAKKETKLESHGIYIKGFHVKFPFPRPYPSQISYMHKILCALTNKTNALLESPTGSGKTLALICAALAWQVEEKIKRLAAKDDEEVGEVPKIFFVSRTHSQLNQAISELKRTSYGPKMVILGSRDQLCVNSYARDPSTKKKSVNEKCNELLKDSSCSQYHNRKRLIEWSKITAESTGSFLSEPEIWNIEDIVRKGQKLHACPYFASREISQHAEFILAPYNYVLERGIRKSMEINLRNAILIIDEAHNIEEQSREAASFHCSQSLLNDIVLELKKLISHQQCECSHKYLLELVLMMNSWMEETSPQLQNSDFGIESLILKREEDFVVFFEALGFYNSDFSEFEGNFSTAHKFASDARKQNFEIAKKGVIQIESDEDDGKNDFGLCQNSIMFFEGLLTVFDYMTSNNRENIADYRLVLRKELDSSTSSSANQWNYRLSFCCMSPRVAFKDMAKSCHSVILTSGTLSPLNSFESELGVEFKEKLETNHVVPQSRILVRSLNFGPNGNEILCTYGNITKYTLQDEIGLCVLRIAEKTPSGMLVFFPSYGLLNKFVQRWKVTGFWKELNQCKPVFNETQDVRAFEKNLREFNSLIADSKTPGRSRKRKGRSSNNGAMFLAVCRGKVSEGIDFADDYARTVITIGIPFPHAKSIEVNLKRSYNDRNINSSSHGRKLSGSEWYELQAYRALNQAIGRCLRHKDDYGAILLIDSRWSQLHRQQNLSKWVRESLRSKKDSRTNDTYFSFQNLIADLSEFFTTMSITNESSTIMEIEDSNEDSADKVKLTTLKEISCCDQLEQNNRVGDTPNTMKTESSVEVESRSESQESVKHSYRYPQFL